MSELSAEMETWVVEPTSVFVEKAELYQRYRPGYPRAILGLLGESLGLGADAVIAEVGSGTGIFSSLLLSRFPHVIGIEPDPQMRSLAERSCGDHSGYRSVAGVAEATTMASGSVDCIAAAQAFHWFDPVAARREFQRIGKPGSYIVLVWNERQRGGTPLLDDLEALLRERAPAYLHAERRGSRVPQQIEAFFDGAEWERTLFPNPHVLDREGLVGRMLSNSWSPRSGDDSFRPLTRGLEDLFACYENDGLVSIAHDTVVVYGRLSVA